MEKLQTNRNILRHVAPLILVAVLAGCAPALVRSELYFGAAQKNGPDVSQQDWQKFVDEVITPRFPNGLTVLEGTGQWRMQDGSLAKEKSRIVILVHSGSPADRKKLDEIRDAYKSKFNQEAVLEIDEKSDVKF